LKTIPAIKALVFKALHLVNCMEIAPLPNFSAVMEPGPRLPYVLTAVWLQGFQFAGAKMPSVLSELPGCRRLHASPIPQ